MSEVTVNSSESLNIMLSNVKKAQEEYASFSQKKVDEIFKKVAIAANSARISLAKLATEETGMGVTEDKVIKNHFASEIIYNKYKDLKTCGVIEQDKSFGFQKLAEPVGILAGIVPTTNPTSTTVFKALIALKTRNAIVFSPHPRARKCTVEAAKIILKAAVEAGAPKNIVGWIDEPSINLSNELMQHPNVKLILATGGPGMVKAAYTSGHPSLGVGSGNTPALIDSSAHIKMAVSSIILSKTFDNGMICASEQSVVVVDDIYDEVKAEFEERGGHFVEGEEKRKLGETIIQNGRLNGKIVGQTVQDIANLAGFSIPADKKVLLAEVSEVGESEPFSFEKLSPVLAMYRAKDYGEAIELCKKLVEFGGHGHTSAIYASPFEEQKIAEFEEKIETSRVLINSPSSQGAIGDLYNFRLDPSLTLGCGTWGGNSISENVEPMHLLNIKTVAERRENMLWFRVPPKIYFKNGSLPVALKELAGKQRAFIVTDKPLYDLGMTTELEDVLKENGLRVDTFYDVEPDPSLKTILRGLEQMKSFNPDVIVAFGGGSPMDAAKVMWLMYEHPSIEFEGLAMRFMDIRKRVYELPALGEKAIMVAIPTTSGTGSEVTPFAVVSDTAKDIKYPLADYALTPNMAIIDPQLVMNLPKELTAFGGIDALTHALETYVSVLASEYTNGLALESIRLLFKYLPSAYQNGAADPKAREKVHYASTIAGMAFANGFLGICHSIAHQLGAHFHIAHGLANALMISHVIRYNATDTPYKQASFSQYKYPNAKWRYARIADTLNLGGKDEEEKVVNLIQHIENLKKQVGIPSSLKEVCGVSEEEFMSKLSEIADNAFDDQCTGTNPRYPLIKDLKELIKKAYYGDCPTESKFHSDVRLAIASTSSEESVMMH